MSQFPKMPEALRLERLEPPKGPVSIILDTDTAAEVDDQFAITYAMLSDGIQVEAVQAAPLGPDPADGMARSHDEILRVLKLIGVSGKGFALRGATSYMADPVTAVASPAADNIIEQALRERPGPLYVVGIGAATNIASAIVKAPEIIRRIVVVWLGGHPHGWPTANEFNLANDPVAGRVLFDSGVPLAHIPCKNVSEHLKTTLSERRQYVKGRGPIGDYLYKIVEQAASAGQAGSFAWSKVIWDISTIAFLVNPEWVATRVVHSPVLTRELTWSRDESRHFVREAVDCRRDPIFADFFRKLERFATE